MIQDYKDKIKGRGTRNNPDNRFEKIQIETDAELDPTEEPAPKTVFFKDSTKKLINYNNSPDVGFDAGINIYRGCEHGCVYCFARPTHEFLGFSCGLDFESRVMVKTDAPQLLARELNAKNYKPQPIAMSGNTDTYQPVERKLELTRQCLEVFNQFKNPVCIITKNRLIERDVDLLKKLHAYNCCSVFISVTSLDRRLAGELEPRASRPEDRLKAIKALSREGIPVGVLVAPVIPGLTDHEIPAILKAAYDAGAQSAGTIMLRLPYQIKDLFAQWLEDHYPNRKNKVLNRLFDIRGGKLNDPRFKTRMCGEGVFAEQIKKTFSVYRKKIGYNPQETALDCSSFIRRDINQFELFQP